jgi:hypothetical protein
LASATVPTNAGTYTVVASFTSADANYADAQSAAVTFTIGKAAPSVTAMDAGGTYNGNSFPASATATGVGGAAVSGGFGFSYYVGSTASGTASSTAPTNAGTYTVVAPFTSADANYADAQSAAVTFTIGKATPNVTTGDAGGTYNGNSFPASATATGVGGAAVSGSFAFAYYVGSTANGTASATAPTNVGTYTVVASFTSADANDADAQSASVTFTIGPSAPTVVSGAHATSNPVTGKATMLNVLGTDNGGEANLKYTWSVAVKPTGAADPVFQTNGTNAAKSTPVSFSQAGIYTFRVTIANSQGSSVTSYVSVMVLQTTTSIEIAPVTTKAIKVTRFAARVLVNRNVLFRTFAYDQFENLISIQPKFRFTLSGRGVLGRFGRYFAPSVAGTTGVVTARLGALTAKVRVWVVARL